MSILTEKSKAPPVSNQGDALRMYFDSLLAEDVGADDDVLNETLLLNEDADRTLVIPPTDTVAVSVEASAFLSQSPVENSHLLESNLIVAQDQSQEYRHDNDNTVLEILDGAVERVTLTPEPSADTHLKVPEWGQSYFQCLMFKVAGINLAAPLKRLNTILEWPGTVTVLPGHAVWFVGLVRNRDQNVQVVDLASIIKAKSALPDLLLPLSKRARYIMLIDDGHWGVVSESVSDVLTLASNEVHWHDNKNQKWLVGTVKKEMCALLDVDVLIECLQQGF
ncbi:MAG: hypothetical protein GXP08_03870 [Gammaproteobacteria bacterium]|nr:hypothetical protein [Gammaproteobacteria bacterium]